MIRMADVMSLGQALYILSESHTRDDDELGFIIMAGAGASYRFSQHEYIEAWKAVRHAAGLPVATIHERTETAPMKEETDAA